MTVVEFGAASPVGILQPVVESLLQTMLTPALVAVAIAAGVVALVAGWKLLRIIVTDYVTREFGSPWDDRYSDEAYGYDPGAEGE